jgi:chromosome segregation ATPase
MNTAILLIIAAVGGLLLGAGIYYLIARIAATSLLKKAEEEAEVMKKNKIVEAKEKFIALKLEHDNTVREQDKRLQQQEQRLQQREQQLNQRQGDIQRTLNEVNQKSQAVEQRQQALDYKQQEVEKMHHEAQKQLEQLSGMSAEEAKKQLVEALRDEKSTTFVLDNLETLRKNGRLSRMKALAAQILKIKPICAGTLEGEIIQIDQARGINKALVKMVQYVCEKTKSPESKILAISFVNCRERALMVRDAILERINVKEVLLMETGGLSTVYANDGGIIVVI